MAQLHVRSDQRLGAVGKTRSGKTFVMEHLLADQPRVIVVDSKHRCNFKGYSMTRDPGAALLDAKTIYRPEGDIPSFFWDDALTVLVEDGGGVLYIDELAEITTPNRMPEGLQTIFRLGGELGVGVWWAAQSPTEIFNTAIRQSDIILMFLLIGASDRDKLIKGVGDMAEASGSLAQYEFIVYQNYATASQDERAVPAYRYVPETVPVETRETQTVAVAL